MLMVLLAILYLFSLWSIGSYYVSCHLSVISQSENVSWKLLLNIGEQGLGFFLNFFFKRIKDGQLISLNRPHASIP